MLLGQGCTASEVARITGIPRSTVRDWSCGRNLRQPRGEACAGHDFSFLNPVRYAYLLGMYLGDGCISSHPRGVWRLRITLDAVYPGIVAECAAAVEAAAPGKCAYVLRRRDQRTAEVSTYWKHWPCLIPQHGKGPKHLRRIALAEWQLRIVTAHPEPFLRGLIHSDGTRIIATERKGRWIRRAPRYGFSNRSEDILQLFAAACCLVGVHFTRSGPTQIAVYSKDSVALIGPKR